MNEWVVGITVMDICGFLVNQSCGRGWSKDIMVISIDQRKGFGLWKITFSRFGCYFSI
jgi:cellulase/cellobiase CelA1